MDEDNVIWLFFGLILFIVIIVGFFMISDTEVLQGICEEQGYGDLTDYKDLGRYYRGLSIMIEGEWVDTDNIYVSRYKIECDYKYRSDIIFYNNYHKFYYCEKYDKWGDCVKEGTKVIDQFPWAKI